LSKTTARKPVKKLPARKSAPAAKARAALTRTTAAPAKGKPVAKKPTKPAAKAVKPVTLQRKGAAAASVKASHKPVAPARSAPAKHAPVKAAAAPVAAKHVTARHAVPAAPAKAAKGALPAKGAPSVKAVAPATKPAAAASVVTIAAKEKPGKPGRKAGKEKAERIEIKLTASTPEDRQSQLKLLIARGKEQSFLTYAEVNDHLPSEIVDPEQIEDIVQMINDMGIPVYEKAPDAEALLMREPVVADDEAAEEAAAALATTVDAEFGRSVENSINSYAQSKLTSIVVNFVDMLAHGRSDSSLLKEIAPDESAYRSLTRSWFVHSSLFGMLRTISRNKNVTVILTTDHGSIRSLRGTKVLGDREASTNLRYKYGRNLKSEEKAAIFVKNPLEFKLPKRGVAVNYIIAKEDYYFVYPTDYHRYLNQYRDSFQHGGASMEEMILPVVRLVPKG